MNLPNLLTLLRVLLIPVFVVCFYLPLAMAAHIALAVFILASVTDWLDGLLARYLGQQTRFGAFLDPVADKLMVSTALVLLLERDSRVLIAIPVAVIIGREITISALREWMAEIGRAGKVKVALIGKVKTIAQMVAIGLMILHQPIAGWPVYEIGVCGLYVATALTLWSMVAYLRAAWPSFRD